MILKINFGIIEYYIAIISVDPERKQPIIDSDAEEIRQNDPTRFYPEDSTDPVVPEYTSPLDPFQPDVIEINETEMYLTEKVGDGESDDPKKVLNDLSMILAILEIRRLTQGVHYTNDFLSNIGRNNEEVMISVLANHFYAHLQKDSAQYTMDTVQLDDIFGEIPIELVIRMTAKLGGAQLHYWQKNPDNNLGESSKVTGPELANRLQVVWDKLIDKTDSQESIPLRKRWEKSVIDFLLRSNIPNEFGLHQSVVNSLESHLNNGQNLESRIDGLWTRLTELADYGDKGGENFAQYSEPSYMDTEVRSEVSIPQEKLSELRFLSLAYPFLTLAFSNGLDDEMQKIYALLGENSKWDSSEVLGYMRDAIVDLLYRYTNKSNYESEIAQFPKSLLSDLFAYTDATEIIRILNKYGGESIKFGQKSKKTNKVQLFMFRGDEIAKTIGRVMSFADLGVITGEYGMTVTYQTPRSELDPTAKLYICRDESDLAQILGKYLIELNLPQILGIRDGVLRNMLRDMPEGVGEHVGVKPWAVAIDNEIQTLRKKIDHLTKS